MARPATIQDEDLLAAAREEFLANGLGATTASIARRAGVSEGTLFKRFGSKEALFRAAMDVRAFDEIDACGRSKYIDDIEARVGQGAVGDFLIELGTYLLEKFLVIVPMVIMTHAKGTASLHDFSTGPPPGAVQGVEALARYLEGEMRLGRVRKADAEVLALSFSGAMWQYAFLRATSRHEGLPRVGKKAFVKGVVDNLWRGIAPSP
ncbi:MAG TPA: helix-turn-helix domain-containing protein [Polyangiaceae bacterium]|nr:helix-turn-helix domain-containing protein [Polyangiaceae bacterium]